MSIGTIKSEDAHKLREMWGKKPCNHPERLKEYFNSSSTGDYVCSQCGEAIHESEYHKLDEKR